MDYGFSIRMPDGSRAFIDCSDSTTHKITVAGKVHYFEFSDRFGPLFTNKSGRVLEKQNNATALRAVSLWCLQGKRMDGVVAVWHEPKKPVYQKRGRELFVIEPGEEGADW